MTITKEYINKKYGNANLKRMEEAHSDDMLAVSYTHLTLPTIYSV